MPNGEPLGTTISSQFDPLVTGGPINLHSVWRRPAKTSDDTFGAVQGLLGYKSNVDLTLLILYYSSLSLALQAIKVELPDGVASTL